MQQRVPVQVVLGELVDLEGRARAAMERCAELGARLTVAERELNSFELDVELMLGRLAVYVERLASASLRDGYDPTALFVDANESTSALHRLHYNELGRWK